MNINRQLRLLFSALAVLASFAPSVTHSDIFNWQTGETIPGTEGLVPEPIIRLSGWNTDERNLQFADFERLDLSSALFFDSWLDNALYQQANLTRANFFRASLTGAYLSQTNTTGDVALLAINYVTWHNIENPFDVDGLDGTSRLDALLVINELADRVFSDPITGQLPLVGSPPPYLDVNNDGVVSPLDPLLVINALPSTSGAPSSEVPESRGVLPLVSAALFVLAARRRKSSQSKTNARRIRLPTHRQCGLE